MKIISQEGSTQGWPKAFVCKTSKGRSLCGAVLLVSFEDLSSYYRRVSQEGECETTIYFVCPVCGQENEVQLYELTENEYIKIPNEGERK